MPNLCESGINITLWICGHRRFSRLRTDIQLRNKLALDAEGSHPYGVIQVWFIALQTHRPAGIIRAGFFISGLCQRNESRRVNGPH